VLRLGLIRKTSNLFFPRRTWESLTMAISKTAISKTIDNWGEWGSKKRFFTFSLNGEKK